MRLTVVGLSIFFYTRRAETGRGGLLAMYGVMLASILWFLGGIHMPIRAIGRPFALVAAVDGALLGANLLMGRASGIALVSCAGIAAMSGIALMDMLLGHAYLTASKMTMRPFVRLHLGLAVVTVLRAACPGGLGLVIGGAVGFLILAARPRTFYLGVWILVGMVVVDVILAMVVGRVTVCYRCRREFPGVGINPAHGGFDLATAEKYRGQKSEV